MGNHPDDFKWFGEGFDGFPKRLPDDCVQYSLYTIVAKLSDFDVRQQLRVIQTAANALCKKLLKDYIWQQDGFELELVQQEGHSFLRGRTSFGDSVEDEWLIVYLLRELSREFPQSWIRVFDSDGEFLLIEAADALPKWLTPDVAENRIWLNNGKLLVIPVPPKNEKAHAGGLKIDDALRFINDRPFDLLHTSSIESEAFYRLKKYPAQIKNNLHNALITIPRKLAYILHENPAYISPAVDALYLRDPIALRPLQSRQLSMLIFAPEDFVSVSVKFTKVGYAQLKGQNFEIPPAWAACLAKRSETFDQSAREIGMKVTCGFEMLLSDPQNVDKKSVREIKILLDDLNVGEEQLPSDETISHWVRAEDDESWLDIDYDEFEKELSGKANRDVLGQSAGFGDKTAQDNLRRMVARFETLLNDDDETAEDEELDDATDDDDTTISSDGAGSHGSGGEEAENKIDFDEARFASMMRDMMGMPLDTMSKNPASLGSKSTVESPVQEENNSVDEERGIQEVMDDTEDELRQAGALSLYSTPQKETSR